MKKVIIVALLVLSLLFMPNVSAAKKKTVTTTAAPEKVKVYLFWASWCPHCHDFINYFADKYQDYEDKFEIVTYQVNVGDGNTPNEVNSTLMSYVGSTLGREGSGIPLIVIGDWYQSGFGTDGTNIIEKAIAAGSDKNYKDVVAEVIANNKLDSDPQPFSKAVEIVVNPSETEDTKQEETKSNDTLIVVIVFAIIVLGFGGLFLYSRKN